MAALNETLDQGEALYNRLRNLTFKAHFRLTNMMGSDIVIHCQSGNDDLKRQTVKDRRGFSFEFMHYAKMAPIHYWCEVWWGEKYRHMKLYGEGAPEDGADIEIRPDGFYRKLEHEQNWNKFLDW